MGDPLWWDEAGVPRYVEFSPRQIWNPYADEAVLLLIACHGCGHQFEVAMSRRDHTYYRHQGRVHLGKNPPWETVPHYGDPPNIECCGAGPVMNVDTLQVLEHWRRDLEWVRANPPLTIESIE